MKQEQLKTNDFHHLLNTICLKNTRFVTMKMYMRFFFLLTLTFVQPVTARDVVSLTRDLTGSRWVRNAKNSTERFRLLWEDVTYQPGELKAVSYKEGARLAESVMRTAGEPYALRLTAYRTAIKADGMDLSYVLIEAIDKYGNLCPLADNTIDITLTGPARFAGVGNGDPQSLDPFQNTKVKLFYAKAMVILGAGLTAGEFKLSAGSNGIAKATVSLTVK